MRGHSGGLKHNCEILTGLFRYYAAGGFFIWYCDRLIRVIHAAQQLGPVVVWPEGDVVR